MSARLARCCLCGGTRGVMDPRPDGTGQHHQPIDCVAEERDQARAEAARLRLWTQRALWYCRWQGRGDVTAGRVVTLLSGGDLTGVEWPEELRE